jgi:outer membrane protein
MKNLIKLLFALGISASLQSAIAADLLEVYHHAQDSDQTYKQAQATYLSAKTTVGQTQASLLPNLGLTGSWTQTNTSYHYDNGYGGNSATSANSNSAASALALNLTQTLFNWQQFKSLEQVKTTVKAAAANYAAAAQDLIMRMASAYFAVLQAEDVVRFTDVQMRALNRQLQVATQRYQVGLDAITAVYDAQAQSDAMRATYIQAQNSLSNQREALREITGQLYPNLYRLKDDFPLLTPNPTDINQWVETAEQQNLTLLAQNFSTQAARQTIGVTSAQNYPTLQLSGAYGPTNTQQQVPGPKSTQYQTTTSYGVNLAMPIYAGGGINAQVQQAQYNYQGALAQLDLTHRTIVGNTRKAYLGIVAEISQIEADRQAIKSAKSALASNEAGYRVGTQTILNVLNAETTLYQAETTYAQDRFNYVMNTLTLKQAAGTLNANDVVALNQWLTNQPVVEEPEPVIKPLTKKLTHKAVKKHHRKVA